MAAEAGFGVVPLEQVRTMDGLTLIKGLMEGRFPAPPISEVLGFDIAEVDSGRVVFTYTPVSGHYNPLGTVHGGVHMWLNDLGLGAAVPWTLRHDRPDHETLAPASEMPKIDYPKYDGVLTFDKLSSVFISNTNHEEDQPSHLKLRDPSIPVAVNLARYDGPEQR